MAQDNKSGSSGSSGRGTSNRGFASMDPETQREIASKGGRSVPPEERSFSKDRALAAEAGRKGGEASHGGRRSAQGGQQSGGQEGGQSRSAASGGQGAQRGGEGNFANDRERPSEAGRKGGESSHGGGGGGSNRSGGAR